MLQRDEIDKKDISRVKNEMNICNLYNLKKGEIAMRIWKDTGQ